MKQVLYGSASAFFLWGMLALFTGNLRNAQILATILVINVLAIMVMEVRNA